MVCLDARNMNKTLGGLEERLKDSNAIIDIRTDKFVTTKNFKKIFLNFTDTDILIKKLAKYNSFIKFYESGGSAATLALSSAVKMGFSSIVLAGIDLAFKDNVIYTDGYTMQRISHDEILVDNVKKNLVQVRYVKGNLVTTREDYQAFINHFEVLVKSLNHQGIYNISSFGAFINGIKNITFEELSLFNKAALQSLAFVKPFKFDIKDFMQEEFYNINNIISMLSKEIFSPVLVTTIVKSVFIYQYLQAEVLQVLQRNFANELAENFISKTKIAIKTVVELLQKNRLI